MTGLPEGCIAAYIDGKQLSRPAELSQDARWEVLLNGAPGMHPGDLRKAQVEYPEPLRAMVAHADPRRMHVLFFSTRGRRSLADQIAGKDYDGDECYLINWQPLVNLCTEEDMQPPYDPHNPPRMPPMGPAKVRAAKKPKTAEALAAASEKAVAAVGGDANGLIDAPRATAQARASDIGERLTFNFIFARFLCSPLVQTAGRQWMVFADKRGGANSLACKQIDEIYRQGLDKNDPPNLNSFREPSALAEYLRRCRYPSQLRSKVLPPSDPVSPQ